MEKSVSSTAQAKQKSVEFTGTDLKLIAVITMLIDHIGVAIMAKMIRHGIDPFPFVDTIDLYHVMRIIGRMAFPIYCYMLVEGFIYTRNVKKYGLRLLAIAVLSEIPFNLVVRQTFFTFEKNNVLWELLLGLVVLYALKEIDKKQLEYRLSGFLRSCALLIGMVVAHFANLDYGEAGICCITAMYVLNGSDKIKRLMAFATGVAVLALLDNKTEAWAFFMLIPMFYYEGNRGFDNKALRLFFYLFYPVHLLILALIANLFIL